MGNKGWITKNLGEVTKWKSGGTPRLSASDHWNGDIPWISASSMKSKWLNDSERRITPKGLDAGSNLAPKGTVLLLVRGSELHKRVPVGITSRDVAFNQDVKALAVTNGLTSSFLYYWLLAKESELLSRVESTGIGAGKLDTDVMHGLEISFPKDLKEQHRVVELFEALDDKIDLNQRTTATLEAMARALFRSWFVDFDPVRAKAAGKKTGLPKEIEKLFPSRLLKSELGEVPEGWNAGCFGDIGNQVSERAGKQKVEVLSAVATGNLVLSDEHFTKQVYSKETSKYLIVQPGDFAYNPSRINIGSIGIHEGKFTGGVSPVYVVVRPQKGFGWFLECSLTLESTRAHIKNFSSGSVRQSLSYKDFASIPCIIPKPEVLAEFNRRWVDFRSQASYLELENKKLEEIRNALLPKLLHGS